MILGSFFIRLIVFLYYSDAAGLLYQWGRKDPYAFANKSSGAGVVYNGLNPLKIYNAQGKEIVQTLDGGTDTNGGTTVVKESASSMLETVRNPNTYYTTGSVVISQVDLSKDIWSYYWTSYSRGTDGVESKPLSINTYLDGYNQQWQKSIFDPCPYGFRLPSNGTYNNFTYLNNSWLTHSYIAGMSLGMFGNNTWMVGLGRRFPADGKFAELGDLNAYRMANIGSAMHSYVFQFLKNRVHPNSTWTMASGLPTRCIEDCVIGYFSNLCFDVE